MNIVYGFNDKNIINGIEKYLLDNEYMFDSRCCNTKMDLLYEVMNSEDIDTIVLMENNIGENAWSAYEMARILDGRDINVVPLLRDIHQDGGEFVKTLYAAGITSAVFGDVKPSELAKQIVNPRTKKEARTYYKISDITPNLKTVTGGELEKILGYIERAKNNEDMIVRFDNACAELNSVQIKDLLEKINSEKKEILKKSITYKVVFNTKKNNKSVHPGPIEMPVFKNKVKKREFHILYGFREKDVVKCINDALIDNDLSVRSVEKYSKSGIKGYLETNDDVDAVVVVEGLEKRGRYTEKELIEIVEDREINLVVLVFDDRKETDYMVSLYAAGITSAVFGSSARTDDLIKQILTKRTRQEARRYYGITVGNEKFILCDKYKNNIRNYLECGMGSFEERCKFVKSLLDKTQINEFIRWCPPELKEKMIDTELFFKKKRSIRLSNSENSNNPKLILLKDSIEKALKKSKIFGSKEKEQKLKEDSSFNFDIQKILKKKKVAATIVFSLLIVVIVFTKVLIDNNSETIVPETVYGGENMIVQGLNKTVIENDTSIQIEEYTTIETEGSLEYMTKVTEEKFTTVEISTVEETVTEEITTKKVENSTGKNTTEKVTTIRKEQEAVTTKKEKVTTKKEKETTKKSKPKPKVNNTVPKYSENNGVIGSSNMSLIRNTIMSNISGVYNSNMQNLAVYMAKNGLSNAQKAATDVCGNTTLKCSAKTATTTSPSTDSEDILDAAMKLAKKLSGSAGNYGVGINVKFQNNKYIIYVVVVTKE